MATVSCGTTSDRFGFIQRYRHLGVCKLCDWLGVSPSGFYSWCDRAQSARAIEDAKLLKRITRIYEKSHGRYGSPRVYKALKQQGLAIGKKRVERLMKESGLVARCVKVCRRMPKLKNFQKAGKNLLLDMCEPTSLNQVWVGDITYLKVNGKWQYLATIMDLYSRRILSWSLSKDRKTERPKDRKTERPKDRKTSLTIKVLRGALKKRKIDGQLVFHSDRGIEYLGYAFKGELEKHGIRQSFNRAGHCTDNAFMESFYHSLKGELIRNCFRANASTVTTYINGFYNRVRLHSGIGYLSPMEFEQRVAG